MAGNFGESAQRRCVDLMVGPWFYAPMRLVPNVPPLSTAGKDALIPTLAAQAHQAGMRSTFTSVPRVALLIERAVPFGIDPATPSAALRDIVARHSVGRADTPVALRAEPAPERPYRRVNGHPSGQGQPVAAACIAQQPAAKPDSPFGARCGLAPVQFGTDQ